MQNYSSKLETSAHRANTWTTEHFLVSGMPIGTPISRSKTPGGIFQYSRSDENGAGRSNLY
jgi:hypothetical protein